MPYIWGPVFESLYARTITVDYYHSTGPGHRSDSQPGIRSPGTAAHPGHFGRRSVKPRRARLLRAFMTSATATDRHLRTGGLFQDCASGASPFDEPVSPTKAGIGPLQPGQAEPEQPGVRPPYFRSLSAPGCSSSEIDGLRLDAADVIDLASCVNCGPLPTACARTSG